jgi:hypothetical protein
MRSLLALGVAAGLAAIVAIPGAAQAAAGSAAPSQSASASPTASPTTSPPTSPGASSSTSPSPAKSAPPKKRKPSPKKHTAGVTVTGPHMYNPNTASSDFKTASTVTVSQTTNLVNQTIQVSWTGFTPSGTGGSPVYNASGTDYPVMVAQCRGTDPKIPDDCYDATNGGSPATFGADGPGNTAYAITEQNGTGTADILLFTSVQNQWLGCGPTTGCSLVIMPSQGGDSVDYATPHCGDHADDNQFLDLGEYAFTSFDNSPNTAYCSWQKRIVIPLRFAPTPDGCPLRNADFTAGGSPMLADAMQEWQTGFCEGANSVEVQYNSEVNESEARTDFADGLDNIAFTTLPLSGPTKYPYTYAPVAVSAATVAYWVDNSVTGQPYTNLKLDPRLVTKLLTTSYAYTNDACPNGGAPPFGCDNAVDNNPINLYSDPEFEKLNPKVGQNPAQPTGTEIPNIVSGDSDMTWVTTSWIAANQDAASFLAGQFDPWGMHVNTYYLGLKYPTDAFLPMDPYPPISFQYSPVYPLSTVATDMSEYILPGTEDVKDPTTGNYDSLPPETVGDRDMWSVLDLADATRFLIPTAAIENAAGKYVEPTSASMTAAVNDMTVNADGVRSINEASKDPNEYPLTMIIYAVVPTGGISQTKADKIAQFLYDVAGEGQKSGTAPGELAPGYMPLTSALLKQTLKAAYEVLHQTGNTEKSSAPSTSPSASPSASKSPSASESPSDSPSAAPTAHGIAVSFSSPDSIGMSWVVLALLIAGFVLVVAGPAALVAGSPAARAAIAGSVRRIKRISTINRNKPGGGARHGGFRPALRPVNRSAARSLWRRNS